MFKQIMKLIVLLIVSSVVVAKEPMPNLDAYKKQLVNYYDSGEYAKDVKLVTMQASAYIEQRVADNNKSAHPKKLAIVFDIDDTLLSNYPAVKQNDFCQVASSLHSYQLQGNAQAIADVLALYRLAIKDTIAVFIITERTDELKEATVRNLKNAGITMYQQLIMKPASYHEKTNIDFKREERKKIDNNGYTIIANIGDQDSDLIGNYASKNFKLPNPFYFIP